MWALFFSRIGRIATTSRNPNAALGPHAEDRDGVAQDALVHMAPSDFSAPEHLRSGNSLRGLHLDSRGRLFRGDAAIELPEDEAKVLAELIARAGHVVTHAQLRRILHADKATSGQIGRIVQQLQDRIGGAGTIQLVYKRGFRFLGDVRLIDHPPVRAVPRLAILPFETGPGVPEYLGEAVAEEAGRRMKLQALGTAEIAEPDSVTALLQRRHPPIEIGAAMAADWVLTGSLLALPGWFRLRAGLIRVADGQTLWTEDLMAPGGKVYAAGAELAERVLSRMDVGIALASAAEEEERPHQQEAYDLLWHARREWRSLERHQMQDGLQRLRSAVATAPLWPQARIDLVNLCTHQAMNGFMAMREAAELIRITAAGAEDRASDMLLPALGWVYLLADRNLALAEAAFDGSAHLPHDRWITRIRTTWLLSLRRFPEAIDMLERSIRLDPFTGGLYARLAWALHLAGLQAQSLKMADYLLDQFADHDLAGLFAAIILAHSGSAERAVGIAERFARRRPYLDPPLSVHAYSLVRAGRDQEARAVLDRLEWLSKERHVLRFFTPAVYVALGDHDAAIDELRAADRRQCPWFFQIMADPSLAPLGDRDEFRELAAILPAMKSAAAQSDSQLRG